LRVLLAISCSFLCRNVAVRTAVNTCFWEKYRPQYVSQQQNDCLNGVKKLQPSGQKWVAMR